MFGGSVDDLNKNLKIIETVNLNNSDLADNINPLLDFSGSNIEKLEEALKLVREFDQEVSTTAFGSPGFPAVCEGDWEKLKEAADLLKLIVRTGVSSSLSEDRLPRI